GSWRRRRRTLGSSTRFVSSSSAAQPQAWPRSRALPDGSQCTSGRHPQTPFVQAASFRSAGHSPGTSQESCTHVTPEPVRPSLHWHSNSVFVRPTTGAAQGASALHAAHAGRQRSKHTGLFLPTCGQCTVGSSSACSTCKARQRTVSLVKG